MGSIKFSIQHGRRNYNVDKTMAVLGFQRVVCLSVYRALETVIKKIVDYVHIVSLKAALSSTITANL